MRKFAYALNSDHEYQIYLYEDNQLESPNSIEYLMMNRLDFAVKTTEIPPVPLSEVGNLLQYKLRSIYPGDPEQTVFDFRVIQKEKQRYAVLFISKRDKIEHYKDIAAKKPLVLPFGIFLNYMKKAPEENVIFLFWNKDWIDVSIFDQGIFKASSAIKREKESFLDFLKIRNVLPSNYNDYKVVFYCSHDESSSLEKQSYDVFKDNFNKEFLVLEDHLPLLFKKSEYLFRRKKQSFFFQKKLKIKYLVAATAVLAVLLFGKYVDTRSQYLKKLERSQRDAISFSALYNQYKKRNEELNVLKAKKPVDVYLILSEVSRIFGDEAKITSFQFERKNLRKGEEVGFRIKGQSRSFLQYKYVDQFEEHPLFSNIRFEMSTDTKTGFEIFNLEGVYNAQ
ncbi:MAG: hypothetical protein JXR70_06225 [Spirochaetales bacterium]|nr:hypothetical protein [Spirochaetales bacterium]